MAMMTDVRGKPGDIVLVRGNRPITVWRDVDVLQSVDVRAGTVTQRALGLIIMLHRKNNWTYVLWSMPCIAGWCHDGELRPVKVKP
jgi:hypothetical protein